MDFLQITLIFLIILLSVFLTIMGLQVFLILKNLKRALDRLNEILDLGIGPKSKENSATNLIDVLKENKKILDSKKNKPRRFYKKTL